MTSVQEYIDQWARGYRPCAASQRSFRSDFRLEAAEAIRRLLELIDERDELEILGLYRQLGAHLGRLDAELRVALAGDRWIDTGRTAAVSAGQHERRSA